MMKNDQPIKQKNNKEAFFLKRNRILKTMLFTSGYNVTITGNVKYPSLIWYGNKIPMRIFEKENLMEIYMAFGNSKLGLDPVVSIGIGIDEMLDTIKNNTLDLGELPKLFEEMEKVPCFTLNLSGHPNIFLSRWHVSQEYTTIPKFSPYADAAVFFDRQSAEKVISQVETHLDIKLEM